MKSIVQDLSTITLDLSKKINETSKLLDKSLKVQENVVKSITGLANTQDILITGSNDLADSCKSMLNRIARLEKVREADRQTIFHLRDRILELEKTN